VKLPFGHPIAIAVCIWVGRDLIRRLRRGIPFEAETGDPTFGDEFESGPPSSEPITLRLEGDSAVAAAYEMAYETGIRRSYRAMGVMMVGRPREVGY
jgi:hypothetical protein